MSVFQMCLVSAVWLTIVCINNSVSVHLYSSNDDSTGYDNIAGSKVTTAPFVNKNVTAHYCPFPCTVGNITLCYPPPCPPPGCVDPTKIKPTDCCEYCPNGPDCSSPDGKILAYNHWRKFGDLNCTCLYPGHEATCVKTADAL